MIEAVTYGMIPSAKIEKRERAEPENRFSRPRIRAALAIEVLLDLIPSSLPALASTSRAGRAKRIIRREEDAGAGAQGTRQALVSQENIRL